MWKFLPYLLILCCVHSFGQATNPYQDSEIELVITKSITEGRVQGEQYERMAQEPLAKTCVKVAEEILNQLKTTEFFEPSCKEYLNVESNHPISVESQGGFYSSTLDSYDTCMIQPGIRFKIKMPDRMWNWKEEPKFELQAYKGDLFSFHGDDIVDGNIKPSVKDRIQNELQDALKKNKMWIAEDCKKLKVYMDKKKKESIEYCRTVPVEETLKNVDSNLNVKKQNINNDQRKSKEVPTLKKNSSNKERKANDA